MLAATDIKAPDECMDALKKEGFEIIRLPPFPFLPSPVSSHPDMLMFICDNTLITHRKYYVPAKEQIEKIAADAGLDIVLSGENISDTYPGDILFNAAVVGNSVIGLKKSVSHMIPALCQETGRRFINVNQGYSKCSVCVVDDNAIITSDPAISAKAAQNGTDVLKIRPGYIRLDGYDTGFIGGCSGKYKNRIYFCGDVMTHPDGQLIADFCHKHGKEVVSLGKNTLYDIGTMFLFE